MSRTTFTTSPSRPASHYQSAPPDRGCSVWPQCVSCPWNVCIAELPADEHATFVHALKLVRSYLAAPDSAITR